jgi:hypothetical protein
MKPQEFKSRYRHTIQSDPETQQNYIKLPITDFNELAYMQESLLDGIILLTQLEKRHYKREQLQSVMYWFCKILLAGYPNMELDGLSEWLKQE